MEKVLSVAAKDVQPGDQIWDPDFYAANKWVTIRQVFVAGNTISLATGSGEQWTPASGTNYVFHARQGVAVRRQVQVTR